MTSAAIYEVRRPPYLVSTDKSLLQMEAVHGFIQRAYWAKGRTEEKITRSIENSICFGLYEGSQQLGFARVVSDLTVYAHLMDVFISEQQRGQGLGKWLVQAILGHPDLAQIGRWTLSTKDAHGLYTQLGFTPLAHPEMMMEKINVQQMVRWDE